MKESLTDIKLLTNEGNVSTAIDLLNQLIAQDSTKAEVYYLLGNAYRKQGNWQGALNNYQEAIDLDPESPANEAKNMVLDILNFYNKDMFNQ